MLRHKQRVFSECEAAESGIGGGEGMKKKYKDMTLEEKIEYAKKRAERSDRFTTFALIFVSICWFLILTIEVIIKFCV